MFPGRSFAPGRLIQRPIPNWRSGGDLIKALNGLIPAGELHVGQAQIEGAFIHFVVGSMSLEKARQCLCRSPELARLKFRDALIQVGFRDQPTFCIRTRQTLAQHLELPRSVGWLTVIQLRPGREIIGICLERVVGGNLG